MDKTQIPLLCEAVNGGRVSHDEVHEVPSFLAFGMVSATLHYLRYIIQIYVVEKVFTVFKNVSRMLELQFGASSDLEHSTKLESLLRNYFSQNIQFLRDYLIAVVKTVVNKSSDIVYSRPRHLKYVNSNQGCSCLFFSSIQ